MRDRVVGVAVPARQGRAAGGKGGESRIIDLAGGRRHQAHIEVGQHEDRDAGHGAGDLALPDVLVVLVSAAGGEYFLAVGRGIGPGFLEPDDANRTRGRIALDPVPELAIDQHRCLGVVERHLAAGGQFEFWREVGHAGQVERRASGSGRRNVDHQVAAAGKRTGSHHATIGGADQAHIGLAGLGIDHGEGGFLAGVGVAEAHLEAAVDGQQLHLIGNVGQEQHGGLTCRDLRQIGIQARTDGKIVGGEIELAHHQELAVGRDAQNDLAVEGFFRGVDGEDLGAAGDQHGRSKCRGEAVFRGVGLDRAVLLDHLRLDTRQPLIGRLRGGQLEVRPAQFFRLVDRGQGLEEFDAGREIVDRKAGVRFEQDAARHRAGNEDAERTQFGNCELDGEATDTGECEAALDADKEHPIDHRGGAVEAVDHRAVGVQLDDAADQAGGDLPAEHVALERDADRGDVDDRELALQEQADIDLDAFDGAGEFEPGHALQAGDRRRQREHEVGRVVLDVAPGDADLGDLDRQPGRPLEAGAVGRADGEEHAEAGLGDESAVAQEGEVAALATNHQRADGHLGPHRAEAHQFLIGRRRGVDGHIGGGQGDHRA